MADWALLAIGVALCLIGLGIIILARTCLNLQTTIDGMGRKMEWIDGILIRGVISNDGRIDDLFKLHDEHTDWLHDTDKRLNKLDGGEEE